MVQSQNLPVHPWRKTGPSKLFVEVTSRCNLACPMCVKQSPGCAILDGDMSETTFRSLEPVLPEIGTLILNGIGEPLLHPGLEDFVTIARHRMPGDGSIGFQTNGLLLTEERMRNLVKAGLDRISFSLDDSEPVAFGKVRMGAELADMERALDIAAGYRDRFRPLKVGIEVVLQKDNLEDLPDTLRWAAARGVDFALVTHLLAYNQEMNDQSVFNRCTDTAVNHFRKWQERAGNAGLDLTEYYSVLWKYNKSDEQQRLVDFVQKMVNDAADQDIFFDLKNHLNRQESDQRRLMTVMNEAEQVAAETGLDLTLPAHSPRFIRRCDFIEDGGAFISWEGRVHPCYFLWHSYECFVTDWRKYVTAKSFGSLDRQTLRDIWNSPEYLTFRNTVATYDYPFCTNCTLSPCDYIDSPDFEQDCYTNTIPCGDCQWCLGLFQCLQ